LGETAKSGSGRNLPRAGGDFKGILGDFASSVNESDLFGGHEKGACKRGKEEKGVSRRNKVPIN